MASLKDDNINFDKLENGAHSAMEAENLYWLRNDAKFRAVKQKGTYDEFKEIVAAAHLKPLEKTDKLQFDEKVIAPWNPAIKHNQHSSTNLLNISGATTYSAQPEFQIPANPQEFVRVWRSLKTEGEKSSYLLFNTKHKNINKIFSTELTSGLLGQFMSVLREHNSNDSPDLIHILLQELPLTGRFNMGLLFLSDTEKDNMHVVLQRFVPPESLKELQRLYKVE